MNKTYYRVHRACGGEVSFIGYLGLTNPKPLFSCSKCKQQWTSGQDGGEWANLIPENLKTKRKGN